MKTLKKSKYNVVVPGAGGFIYFNGITARVGVFDAARHAVYAGGRFNEPEHAALARQMEEAGYLVPSDRNETRLLKKYSDRFVKPFEFTVELSRVCNFKCTYCYQNGTHDARKVASREVLDACLRYATHVLSTKEIHDFELNFIGGEPLLHPDKLLYVYTGLRGLLERTGGTRWRMALDTNGVLLTDAFLRECRNTTVSLSLTDREDHDRNRTFLSGRSSFDRIVQNIVEHRAHFGRDDNLLLVRYNLDHRNRERMPDFVRFLAGLGVENISFMVVNVVNYDFNPAYRNALTEEDYFEQCGVALDAMIDCDIPVRHIPYGVITPCHVFTPYSCKVFYDGRLNGCDIADQPGEGSIFDLPAEGYFDSRVVMNALTHKLCMGDYKICNLQVFPLRQYLQAYVRATGEGKRHLFAEFDEYAERMRAGVDSLLAEGAGEPAAGGRAELPVLTAPALPTH